MNTRRVEEHVILGDAEVRGRLVLKLELVELDLVRVPGHVVVMKIH